MKIPWGRPKWKTALEGDFAGGVDKRIQTTEHLGRTIERIQMWRKDLKKWRNYRFVVDGYRFKSLAESRSYCMKRHVEKGGHTVVRDPDPTDLGPQGQPRQNVLRKPDDEYLLDCIRRATILRRGGGMSQGEMYLSKRVNVERRSRRWFKRTLAVYAVHKWGEDRDGNERNRLVAYTIPGVIAEKRLWDTMEADYSFNPRCPGYRWRWSFRIDPKATALPEK